MSDSHIYHIQLNGQIIADEINAIGPLKLTAIQVNTERTTFTVCTDQSGLIGLLRYLHARGLVILSVIRKPKRSFPGGQNVKSIDHPA